MLSGARSFEESGVGGRTPAVRPRPACCPALAAEQGSWEPFRCLGAQRSAAAPLQIMETGIQECHMTLPVAFTRVNMSSGGCGTLRIETYVHPLP